MVIFGNDKYMTIHAAHKILSYDVWADRYIRYTPNTNLVAEPNLRHAFLHGSIAKNGRQDYCIVVFNLYCRAIGGKFDPRVICLMELVVS